MVKKKYFCGMKTSIMRKASFLLLIAVMSLTSASAQLSRQEIKQNIYLMGSNYFAYPGPSQEQLTPSPAGYEPFYLSHYGRHGSRHLINDSDYDNAYNTLLHADSLGKLTPLGSDVLSRVRLLRDHAYKRHGELTQLGAEQHQAIGARMYDRFPEVFAGKTPIDAKSTVVIRCILSMENALHALLRKNPEIEIRHDASEHDMWYMNKSDRALDALKMPKEIQDAYDAFCKRHQHNDRLMTSLFNDEFYWRNQVDAQDLAYHLFKMGSNIQSTDLRNQVSLYDLFTEEELYDLFLQTNAWWYINFGPCPLNGGVSPYSQRDLLRMMITEADSCLRLSHPGATLRYGHEVCVLPLACLLELDNCAKPITDFEQLDDEGWLCYKIFPMACNIQMIFYRPTSGQGDILMKVLLNENEATLPLKPVSGPYYKWSDFRTYFINKLDQFNL